VIPGAASARHTAGMSRWDWLEGVRRQRVVDVLLVEAARQLADEIQTWPPALEWTDERSQREFAPLFAPDAGRPGPSALALGFQLARWELARELDAIEHAVRGGEVSLGARFLWRWLPEWLLELKERCDNQLSRAQLLDCLRLAEARLRGWGE
jgi:hypothetical protein